MLVACVCFLLYLSFVYAAIEINFSMNKIDYKWSKSCAQTFRRGLEKLLKFLPILAKIVALSNNLVQIDANHFKLCFFL